MLLINLDPIHSQRKHNVHPRRHMHNILSTRMAPKALLSHRRHRIPVQQDSLLCTHRINLRDLYIMSRQRLIMDRQIRDTLARNDR
jgi:hypothetical protein